MNNVALFFHKPLQKQNRDIIFVYTGQSAAWCRH